MDKIIKINEIDKETVFKSMMNSAYSYSKDLILKCIDTQINNNLSYNCTNGITRDKSGIIANFTKKEDIPKYENIEEVIFWEFSQYINNSCSRMVRGYSA